MGYCLIGISSVVAIYIAKKFLNFSITDSMIKPAVASMVMLFILIILKRFLPVNYYSFGILILSGVLVYGISIVSMIGAGLIEDAKKSINTIFNK